MAPSARKIVMIPHGVPDRAVRRSRRRSRPRFGWEGRKVVLTFGLLAPNKGIETMIEAMPAIVAAHPDALYVVLGATHPNLVAHEGEAYRDRLKALAAELGVARPCRASSTRFVEHDELLDYLQAADIYVTPYTNPAQITSGTLSYAVGVGKAVVSTPYVHATEILADGHGVLVDFGDSAAFAREIDALLGAIATARSAVAARLCARPDDDLAAPRRDRDARDRRRWSPPSRAASSSRAPRIAPLDARSRRGRADERRHRHAPAFDLFGARSPPRLLHRRQCPRADADERRSHDLDEDARDKWTTIYASFVQYAWNPDARRFRNFMNFDRTWCEDVGSEDSNGRTLWALGVTARDAQRAQASRLGGGDVRHDRLDRARSRQSRARSAFAMLGAAAMLEAHPGPCAVARRSSRASATNCSRCSRRRAGPNGTGSRSSSPMTMPACPRR